MSVEPLELQFDLACSAEHAFDVWTSRTAMWWPRDHTVSEEAQLEVVLEPRAGGRIFERTRTGTEHDWGEILAWDPPHRLAYSWFLGTERSQATEVEVTFVARGENAAQIRIEHRGWERLGAAADRRREGNKRGWDDVLRPFLIAATSAEPE